MPSKSIGIYAPYTWGEPTQMACVLGDLAREFAQKVNYLSTQAHNTPIHFRWDSKVRSFRKLRSFGRWASLCSHIVWFDVHKEKLRVARSRGCRNILVPLWHRLQPSTRMLFHQFDSVVCPSSALHHLIQTRHVFQDVRLSHWDAGLRIVKRKPGLRQQCVMKLLVATDGQSMVKSDDVLLTALHMLLDSNHDVEVTIMYTRRWHPGAMAQARRLSNRSGGRLKFLRSPDYMTRMNALAEHDWIFCSSMTPNSGIEALEALSLGMPVIAYNLPPFNEFVQSRYNGVLIDCHFSNSPFGAPVGQPSACALFDALDGVLRSPETLFKLQATPWPELQSRNRAFQQVWKNLLQ